VRVAVNAETRKTIWFGVLLNTRKTLFICKYPKAFYALVEWT